MWLPFHGQMHQLNLAAANYSRCKPSLHEQAIPLSISSWGLCGMSALSIHPTQQCHVILLLRYTRMGPVIRALVCLLVDPGWRLFSYCEDSNLNFSLPTWSVWGSADHSLCPVEALFSLYFMLWARKELSLQFPNQGVPHFSSCCTPRDVPRDATPKAFFLLIWQWEGPQSKSKCHLQDFRSRKHWWLGLIVSQTVASNIMVELK